MTSNKPNIAHNCPVCNKGFVRKSAFDKHHLLCAANRVDNGMSNKQLSDIVILLSNRVTQLENRLAISEKHNKKKSNIATWLDENTHTNHEFDDISFIQSTFVVTISHIDTFINNGITQGFIAIFTNAFEKDKTNLPIKCFDGKPGVFWLKHKQCWKIATNNNFIIWFDHIKFKLIQQLCEWRRSGKKSDREMHTYNTQTVQLMDNNCISKHYCTVKDFIYNYLKENIDVYVWGE